MSVKVTYEYSCDICGGEAWGKEENEYTFYAFTSYLQPRIMRYVGSQMVCSACESAAMEPLKKILFARTER